MRLNGDEIECRPAAYFFLGRVKWFNRFEYENEGGVL